MCFQVRSPKLKPETLVLSKKKKVSSAALFLGVMFYSRYKVLKTFVSWRVVPSKLKSIIGSNLPYQSVF
jgi:hypothetical protein